MLICLLAHVARDFSIVSGTLNVRIWKKIKRCLKKLQRENNKTCADEYVAQSSAAGLGVKDFIANNARRGWKIRVLFCQCNRDMCICIKCVCT